MHTKDLPPGRAEASAANAGDRRNERDAEQIPDPARVGNRKLIKSRSGLAFYEVLERRNRVRYEIVSESKTWHFPLLFSAYSKWDRLTRNGAAHP
jgi:hypothetical protein